MRRKDLKLEQAAMRKRWAEQHPFPSEAKKSKMQKADYKPNIYPAKQVTHRKTVKPAHPQTRNDNPKLNIDQGMLLLNVNETPYTEFCLPQTMKMAEESKRFLFSLLRQYPNSWSFSDKVLVLIAPTIIENVRDYYSNNGPSMINMFESHHIEYFDKLLARDLARILKNIEEYNWGRA